VASKTQQVQLKLSEQEVDALLVTDPLNMRYLTGYTGDAGMLIVDAQSVVLAVDPRYTEQALREAKPFEVVEVREDWTQFLSRVVAEKQIKVLGVEAEHVTVQQWEDWRECLQGTSDIKPVRRAISALRRVKSAEELSLIERAAELTDAALAEFRNWIKPGVTEREAAWFIEAYMRTHGAEQVAFELIVAGGPNAALPHARPGERPIKAGEPIVVDIGARVDGYNADLTRTLWLGQTDETFTELYGLVLRAQEAAEAKMKAGMPCRDADALARNVIEEGGYGTQFGHGLGHGVGLAVHEAPSLSSRSDDVLVAGNVVTVEPGIYLSGWGGIRIEDLVVVEDSGIRVLSRSSKEPVIS